MKLIRFMALFIIFFIFTGVAYSLDKNIEANKHKEPSNHELYLGYGYRESVSENLMGTVYGLLSDGRITRYDGIDYKPHGIMQLGYSWYGLPGRGLSMGAAFTVEPYTIEKVNDKKINEHFTAFSFQGKVKFQYGWKYFRIYHTFGVSISFFSIDSAAKTVHFFSHQIVPIGIRLGPEKGLYLFADLALGSSTSLNAGLGYRL